MLRTQLTLATDNIGQVQMTFDLMEHINHEINHLP